MLHWLQSRKWLPEIYLTAASMLLFSLPDYFSRGTNGLIASLILSLTLLVSRWQPLVAIPLVLVANYLAFYYGVGPMLGGLAPLITVSLVAAFTEKLWVRLAVLATVAVAIEARIVGMIQAGQILFNTENQPFDGQPTAIALSAICVGSVVAVFHLLGRLLSASPRLPGSAAKVAKLENDLVEANLHIADLDKRLDIAADISDLVVQNLSAVISRAEGGIYSAKSDPDSAVRSLERSLENAQSANREVRRLVDLLRRRQEVSAAPPGVSDIDALVIRYRELGFSVVYNQEGVPQQLNRGAQLAIYRIVFDSLQFLADLASSGANLSIDFVWSENGLQVLVKDDSISTDNRVNLSAEDPDIEYTASDDLKALVEPLSNATIISCRERAELYGGSAELKLVPGVGHTFSVYFPELRLITAESEQ